MKKSPKTNDLPVALGGEEIDVTHQDGRTETVKVRHLPIDAYHRFQQALGSGNELEMVALYVDHDPAWLKSLTPASYSALADKGEELNLPFIGAWLKRQKARNEAINPGLTEKIEKAMMEDLMAKVTASPLAGSSSISPP